MGDDGAGPGLDLSQLPLELSGRVELAALAYRHALTDAALLAHLNAATVLAPGVEELDISGCGRGVTDSGVAAVLALCPGLRVLGLEGLAHITGAAFDAVGVELPVPVACGPGERRTHSPGSGLEVILLTGCAAIDEEAVIRLVYGSPSLLEAGLGGLRHLRPHSLDVLASQCHLIASLDLTDLKLAVGDAEVAALAAGCPRIAQLRLRRCDRVSDAALAALAEHCPCLWVLDLAYDDRISDEGLAALSRGCPRLAVVSLAFCSGLSNEGVAAFAAAARCLAELDLEQVEEAADETLLALASLPKDQLRWLSLAFTAVTDRGVLAVRSTHAGCRLVGLGDCGSVTIGYEKKHISVMETKSRGRLTLGARHFPSLS